MKLSGLSYAAAAMLFLTPAVHAHTATHCNAPSYHQFDFWLGDWDTYRVASPHSDSVARNRVTSILDNCVLHESYDRADGYAGESFTIYDATRKVWHQTWVTNEGELLVAEGKKVGNKIVLTGKVSDAEGEELQRVSWTPQGESVRETADSSRDGGKTWAPLFDILFRKHRP